MSSSLTSRGQWFTRHRSGSSRGGTAANRYLRHIMLFAAHQFICGTAGIAAHLLSAAQLNSAAQLLFAAQQVIFGIPGIFRTPGILCISGIFAYQVFRHSR